MNNQVFVYGYVSNDEILNTWMVGNGRPSVELYDGSSIGNVQSDFIQRNIDYIAGIACTLPVQTSLLPMRIVSNDECRRLYEARYMRMR